MTSRAMTTRPAMMARPVSMRRRAPAPDGLPRRLAAASWGIARSRPGLVLGTAALALFASAFGWNALMHQGNRHPAPLFGAKPPQGQADLSRRAEPAAAPLPVPRPEPAALSAPAEPLPKASRPDPIGALIRSAEPGARPDESRPDPGKVTSAQRALSRLGYGPLKSDGVMGAGTRQALERFERDQNLPVTGALAGRTARQLAARAGTPQD